ncbi:MAG: insulinase family protein [Bacteroidales bacterium]|nr:insulinase family protein [Bacteroidales bacterium]
MNRLIQPEIKQLNHFILDEPEIYTLENGIKVVQFNAGTQELVKIELVFEAGSWYQSRNFTALATNLMLREGTQKYSSRQISDLLDFYGAHLESTAEKDNAYITLYTLNKHLPNTLPILEDIVKNAAFADTEFQIFSAKQKQLLSVNMEKVNFVARTRFNSLIYGKSHAYGNFLSTEDIDLTTSADLREFHQKFYNPAHCTIVVAGKIHPDLKNQLEQSFGKIETGTTPAAGMMLAPQPESGLKHVIEKDGALQSAIRIGRILFNRSHPDYMGMRVLNTLLGGYFGSRLMTNLREDKGYTYGIGSAVVPLKHSGYFFISCEVGADVTHDAITQIETELEKLRTETIPAHELDLVKNYMIGNFLRGIDGPFALADTYRDIMEQGLDNRFHYQLLDLIRNISAEELKTLAIKYLDPTGMHQLIVGTE